MAASPAAVSAVGSPVAEAEEGSELDDGYVDDGGALLARPGTGPCHSDQEAAMRTRILGIVLMIVGLGVAAWLVVGLTELNPGESKAGYVLGLVLF